MKRASLSHFYWKGYKLVVVFKIGIASSFVRTSLGIVSYIEILENHFVGVVFTSQGKITKTDVSEMLVPQTGITVVPRTILAYHVRCFQPLPNYS